MRRTLVCAAVLAVGLVATGTPAALAEPIGGAKLTGNDVIVDPGPGATPLPDVPASAWVIADLDTGAILAAKAPHVPRPPASTLKTLTALTLIPRLDSGEVYTVTYDDIAIEGSRVGLVEEGTGQHLSEGDRDARGGGVAIARHVVHHALRRHPRTPPPSPSAACSC